MKIYWWDSLQTNPDVYTQTTTTNRLPVLDELIRRGHQVEFTWLPRAVNGKSVEDTGRYASLWAHVESAKVRRKQLYEISHYKANGPDGAWRGISAMKELVETDDAWSSFNADLLFLKNVPCVGMDARLFMLAPIYNAVLSEKPVVILDGEYQFAALRASFSTLVSLGKRGVGRKIKQEDFERLVTVWSPYQKRTWPRQRVMFYVYDTTSEKPLPTTDDEAEFVFGYIGNDYQRHEYLAKFYKKRLADGTEIPNAIWGRWRKEKADYIKRRLDDVVGAETFKGEVPPSKISECYRRCAASIVIAHRKFYAAGMLTQRFGEVIAAGRYLFVDKALRGSNALLSDDRCRVQTPEEAYNRLSVTTPEQYVDAVATQREEFRTNNRLTPSYWVDCLEEVVSSANITEDQPAW